jgi:hypothetical protein
MQTRHTNRKNNSLTQNVGEQESETVVCNISLAGGFRKIKDRITCNAN